VFDMSNKYYLLTYLLTAETQSFTKVLKSYLFFAKLLAFCSTV